MRFAHLAFLISLVTPIAADAAGRDEDISRIRRVIHDEGIPTRGADPNDIDRKLATMSDNDLRTLAQQHAEMGYSGDPLTVVLSSVVLLILLVLVIVAVVD